MEEAIARVSGVEPTAEHEPARRTLRPTSRGKIVGRHASIREVLATIERVAKSSCAVLVTGESGTGKDLVVAALHDASPRSSGPLVAVNCGAIPESLIEGELFGHARGAFAGAHAARQGRVAAAEGGTLFLDEVTELPWVVQGRILHLLQQREYSPLGESRSIACDLRIVAATSRELEQEVARGRFRRDLYDRLDVIRVHLPSLRERGDDVHVLAEHFLQGCCARAGRGDLTGFTPAALEVLKSYDWPGNIRALESTIERAVLLAAGPQIDVEDLPPRVRRCGSDRPDRSSTQGDRALLPETGIDLRAAVEAYENNLILQALSRTRGNKNRAARLLGLNRTTLVEMVKRKRLVV